MSKSGVQSARAGRPTIGLLISRPEETFHAYLWRGVIDVACERDVNLLCFAGTGLVSDRAYSAFNEQRNVIYDLPNTQIVDGLVILSGSLGNLVDPDTVWNFVKRYVPLPMVSVSLALPDIPSILVDNRSGMREAMAHLLQVHRYRRIAFIRGPEGHPEAEERYRVYRAVLEEHNLVPDPDLVAPGLFRDYSGVEAVELWLDRRALQPGRDLEAIVAVDDETASGAIDALQARGIRVPEEIAVVGFDDTKDARFFNPPLTTVRQPAYELGRQAAKMILALLDGDPVPPLVTLPTELVIRRSCGCVSPVVARATVREPAAAHVSFAVAMAARRASLLEEMIRTAGPVTSEVGATWAERLLDACIAYVERIARAPSSADAALSPSRFLAVLEDLLGQVVEAGDTVSVWQNVLSVLRQAVIECLGDDRLALQVENLWQQARILVGQEMSRMHGRQGLVAARQAETLNQVVQSMIATFDADKLVDVLANGLPRLGIPGCYVVLYDPPVTEAALPARARLALAYDQSGRLTLDPRTAWFATRQLVPQDVLPQHRRYVLLIESLHVAQELLGFVAFELGPRRADLYETVRGQLSRALKGVQFLAEHEQIANSLRESQQMLQLIMENIPQAIFWKDKNLRYLGCNRAFAQDAGLESIQDVVGKSDLDMPWWEQAEMYRADDRQVLETGTPKLYYEETLVAGDGTLTWLQTSKVPLYDAMGNSVAVLGMYEDITERKQAQWMLEQRATQLSILNDVSSKIAGLLDLDKLLSQTAQLVQQRFGYHHVALFTVDRERRELVMRAKSGDFAHLFPPGHRLKLGQGMVGWVGQHGERLLANDVSREPRYVNLYPDVIYAQSELSVPLRVGQDIVGVLDVQDRQRDAFDENDVMMMETLADQLAAAIENARLYQAVQQELAERLRAQEALSQSISLLQATLESTNDGILVVDLEGKIVNFNNQFLEMWRMPAEVLASKEDDRLLDVALHQLQDPDAFIAKVRALYAHPEETSFDTLYLQDGRVYERYSQPQRVAGSVVGRVWSFRDVTKRRLAEEALRQKAEELIRSNQELQRFAYVASHDLQEPLRMVTSYLQLLERRYKGRLDQDADEFIAYAVDGAGRMRKLINDLLTYSRVDTRGLPLQEVDATAALCQALENLGPLIEESEAVVTHDPLPVLQADSTQLVQVFQNLISNAVKFRGQAKPAIHVRAERQGQAWQFSVHDNGIGIERQYFERIFVIFQRLHSRFEYPGTGIGLAVCKKIVERHGGRIWVESVPGSGSTFYFTIAQSGLDSQTGETT